MKKGVSTRHAEPRIASSPPRKRFRLARLEERIAPKKKGGGTGAPLSDTNSSAGSY
jgi:hypothetical protein